MNKPTTGEMNAAKLIATAYSTLLHNLGYPDEMNDLPKAIEKVVQFIADHRND